MELQSLYAESRALVSSMLERPDPDQFVGVQENSALCCFADLSIADCVRAMEEEADAQVHYVEIVGDFLDDTIVANDSLPVHFKF